MRENWEERGERDKGSKKERDEGFEMQSIQLVGWG